MTTKYFGLCFLSAALFTSSLAQAYDPSWEGNHPDAKSEAWTWMGHLQEVVATKAGSALGANGVGFIYYYTRNDQGKEGSMNFRSSALTTTLNGVGTAYDTHTIYEAQDTSAEMRVRSGNTLDLTFTTSKVSDTVQTQPMSAADQAELSRTMLLFPGLAAAPGFAPTKTHFQVQEEDGSDFDLNFYAIWPVLAPEGGTLRFLGQAGTYEFASPMLVTVGTHNGTPVAGLSFLDRQWAPQYFGVNIMGNIAAMLQPGHALPFSHSWSAFHAFNERTHEWSFFHLWHQYQRADGVADQLTDYSDMLWMKNGTTQGRVSNNEYSWVGTGYAFMQGRDVMLEYAAGRDGFFPSRANYSIPSLGFKGEMRAAPALQALNQPIYFYEGFASGEATWNGDPVHLQGRLESSRLLFRTQDYQEMLQNLQAQTSSKWQQKDLQSWLKDRIAEDQAAAAQASNPLSWFQNQITTVSSLMGDMGLKLAVLREIISGKRTERRSERRRGDDLQVTSREHEAESCRCASRLRDKRVLRPPALI